MAPSTAPAGLLGAKEVEERLGDQLSFFRSVVLVYMKNKNESGTPTKKGRQTMADCHSLSSYLRHERSLVAACHDPPIASRTDACFAVYLYRKWFSAIMITTKLFASIQLLLVCMQCTIREYTTITRVCTMYYSCVSAATGATDCAKLCLTSRKHSQRSNSKQDVTTISRRVIGI